MGRTLFSLPIVSLKTTIRLSFANTHCQRSWLASINPILRNMSLWRWQRTQLPSITIDVKIATEQRPCIDTFKRSSKLLSNTPFLNPQKVRRIVISSSAYEENASQNLHNDRTPDKSSEECDSRSRSSHSRSIQVEDEKITHTDVHKALPELAGNTYNLAPLVERSETLKNLVSIGVDLSKIEKVKGMADLLVMSDFDKDILPYLQHLAHVGVEPEKLAYIISVNPLLLKEDLGDLERQVGYLLSKKFSLPNIASMFTRAPIMMLMDPVKLDSKFGFLQKSFKLSGYEVRLVALTFPKLLPWRQDKIADMRFNLKEFMGFTDEELKLMLIKEPKLYTANKYKVLKAFDYINNNMLISHQQITQWPAILRQRLHITKPRHLFLLHKGRAQYDPYKENYISMKAMVTCSDDEFCKNIAKTDMEEYYNFLKTL